MYRRSATKPYRAGDFDLLVVWVEPEDMWYVIPYEALAPYNKCKAIYLHTKESKTPGPFDKYRERWDLFK